MTGRFRAAGTALCLAMLAACHAQPVGSAHDEEPVFRTEEALPRIVLISEDTSFPEPLRVRRDPTSRTGYWIPPSLEAAVDELTQMLSPEISAATVTVDESHACRLSDADQLDQGIIACEKLLCARLPKEARDPACSYFGSLQSWVERAWLGGPCVASQWSAATPLANWFHERGVTSCSYMGSAISAALALELAGGRWDEGDLARRYAKWERPR